MNGRNVFHKTKFLFPIFLGLFRILPSCVTSFFWDCISPFGGKIFLGLRYLLLKTKASEVGDNVYIGKYVVIKNIKKMQIGNNVSIHDFCYIDAAGGICIGNNVSIAHNSSILSSNHTWNNPNLPIKYNEVKLESTILSDDIWVGCGVRILAGVKIAERVIVAAGSIVVENIDENNLLVGGVPAKVIKKI